jgi:hypothetical protein
MAKTAAKYDISCLRSETLLEYPAHVWRLRWHHSIDRRATLRRSVWPQVLAAALSPALGGLADSGAAKPVRISTNQFMGVFIPRA